MKNEFIVVDSLSDKRGSNNPSESLPKDATKVPQNEIRKMSDVDVKFLAGTSERAGSEKYGFLRQPFWELQRSLPVILVSWEIKSMFSV